MDIQGKLYIRGDSKIFRFQNGKSESLFLQRKNPRKIAWTVLYRRMHKKGITEVRRKHPGKTVFGAETYRVPSVTVTPKQHH